MSNTSTNPGPRPAEGIAPSGDDIVEAIQMSFALWEIELEMHGEGPPGPAVTVGRSGLDALYDPHDLRRAVTEIGRLYDRRIYNMGELAAGVAAAVRRITLLLPEPYRGLLSAQSAVLVTAAALQRLGYQLDPRLDDELQLQLYKVQTASNELVGLLNQAIASATPEPRVIVLTPLSCVEEDEEHAAVVRVGQMVDQALTPAGFRVDCPGLRLHPDSSHDWSPIRMYRAERRRILNAGLTALAAADVPSWGLGQSKAWAEPNASIVVEFTNASSRALGPGNPYETVTDPWESAEIAARAIIDLALLNKQRLTVFDSDRIALRQRWASQMVGAVKVADLNATRLTDERRNLLLLDPDEAGSATATEMRHLRATNPELADRLIDTVLNRQHARRLALSDLQDASRAEFDKGCRGMGATPVEVDLVLRILGNQTADLAVNRTKITARQVGELIRVVRGTPIE